MVKNLFQFYTLTFLFILPFIGHAQDENSSLYFKISNLQRSAFEKNFDDSYRGYFDVENQKFRQLVVRKDSIVIRVGTEIMMTKEEATNKGFTFENDKMYGMAPLNGVHYAEDNDTIYALYYQYDSYLRKGQPFMKVAKDKYLLMIPQFEDYYAIELMELIDDTLVISGVDHTVEMKLIQKFKDVKEEKIDGYKTYILNPSFKELKKFTKKSGFNDPRNFLYNEELSQSNE